MAFTVVMVFSCIWKTCKQENCYRNSLYSLPPLKKDLNKMSLLKMKSIQTLTPHNAWKMYNIPGKSCLLQDKINNSVIFAIAISSNKILNIRIFSIGGFHVTSSPPCWRTVNKRSLISSLCLSTSICSFHHCYLCLPTLHENHL